MQYAGTQETAMDADIFGCQVKYHKTRCQIAFSALSDNQPCNQLQNQNFPQGKSAHRRGDLVVRMTNSAAPGGGPWAPDLKVTLS